MNWIEILSILLILIFCICFFISLLKLEKRVFSLERLILKMISNESDEISRKKTGSDLTERFDDIIEGDTKHLNMLELSRRNQTRNVQNNTQELIPVNLSQKEKDILRMFNEKSE